MNNLKVHTLESAPEGSQPLLQNSIKAFGSLPSLHGVMAESPVVLEAYQMLHKWFTESSFDADELTVVWQSINVEHECHYCVPAHAAIAKMMKVDDALTAALRNRQAMPNAKLQALHDTTLLIVRNRGQISEADVAAFYAAGYSPKHLLEIVLGLSQKIMSNYINHLADTPLDERFAAFV
ncbi:carboxymuconolactone decarboxylase family protein [Amphritea sp. 2_MG-2023]|uniref:carboxymuconolactone decarboxylase family protein n=1 Tax=Amphritea TaxID=515417 RepID=UPI001C066F9B|nr:MULTISPECIES: carboxymuconolactone decarboxylase family protein [Amphritea]MBU2963887.1 carboxymuconolactone decarboxylase family protein [Amphritea atlantica]MDO6419200.1 carboxymuconolactone decarboxylase family protein [Amphritea sp. 2_MG-2023]MDX2422924.1 carboxymuconolactone decarboxylase family protein [Amphritea sp.]